MKALYFAYGSNLDAGQMRRRCPSARMLFRGQLPHYRLAFTHFSSRWLGGAADVVPHFAESVWGVVYEMDEADLDRLDGFERGYERVLLTVQEEGGGTRAVTSYSVRQKRTFRPTRAYRDRMIAGAEACRLPKAYLARLRAIPVMSE